MIKLVCVEEHRDALNETYDILLERHGDDNVNISNAVTPLFEDHKEFFENNPYAAWYLIVDDGIVVGSVYLTKPPRPSIAGNELGVFIKKRYQHRGYAKWAVKEVMDRHGDQVSFTANINPRNTKSIALFAGMGFDLVQFTFRKNVG